MYFSNSSIQPASVVGIFSPSNFHVTMDNPDSVSLVTPPKFGKGKQKKKKHVFILQYHFIYQNLSPSFNKYQFEILWCKTKFFN